MYGECIGCYHNEMKKVILFFFIFTIFPNNAFSEDANYCYKVYKTIKSKQYRLSENSSEYWKLDALASTAFDLYDALKGTNASDGGNCKNLLRLSN